MSSKVKIEKRTKWVTNPLFGREDRPRKVTFNYVVEMPREHYRIIMELSKIGVLTQAIPHNARLDKTTYDKDYVEKLKTRHRNGLRWLKDNGYDKTDVISKCAQCVNLKHTLDNIKQV